MADTNPLRFENAALWCLIAAAGLVPLGLGGNRPIPFGLAQGALALGFACLLWERKALLATPFFPRLKIALGLFALVLLWGVFQAQFCWLPSGWAHPLWQEAGAALGHPLGAKIALAPEMARAGLARLATYIACGILAYCVGQSKTAGARFLKAFSWIGVGVCAYGLALYAGGIEKVLWFDKTDYLGDLTATFISRNHFAVYANLVLVTGLAFLIQSWRAEVKGQPSLSEEAAAHIKSWVVRQGLPRLSALFLVTLAILASHSRTGLVLIALGTGSYLCLFLIYRKAWRMALLSSAILAVAMIMIAAIVKENAPRFAELFADNSSLDRLQVYRLTVRAMADNPWLGYGVNGFQSVFRLYQPGMLMEFNHAHSDWLESLLDFGVPIGLMLWAAIAVLLSGLWHGLRHRRRNGYFPVLGLVASLIVLSHSAVDFSLQIPGVAMPWAALVGIGLAQSWGKDDKAKIA